MINNESREEYLRMYTCLIEQAVTAGCKLWPGTTTRMVDIPGGGSISQDFMDMRGVFTIGDVRTEPFGEWLSLAWDAPKHLRPVVFTDGKRRRIGVYQGEEINGGRGGRITTHQAFCESIPWPEATHWCPLPDLPQGDVG